MEIINFVTADTDHIRKKNIAKKKIALQKNKSSHFSLNTVKSKQMFTAENPQGLYVYDSAQPQYKNPSFASILLKNYLVDLFFACLILCITVIFAYFYAQTDSRASRLYVTEAIEKADLELLNMAISNFVAGKTQNDDVNASGDLVDGKKLATTDFFAQPVSYTTYYVQSNDNITSITKKFGLSNVSTLIGINQIERVRSLKKGQKLIVPSIDGLFHHIAKNESIISIAEKYNIPVETLVDINDLPSENIKPGDALFIPGAKMNSEDLKKAMGELFKLPLFRYLRVSSPYGWRPDPFTGTRTFHTGIDYVAPQGTSIKASSDGKVAFAGWSNVYGNYVIINHGRGYQTLYGHMLSISVKKGQNIVQGNQVGLVGNTGYSTGAHLHFTVYKNGKTIHPNEVLK